MSNRNFAAVDSLTDNQKNLLLLITVFFLETGIGSDNDTIVTLRAMADFAEQNNASVNSQFLSPGSDVLQ